MNTPFQVSELDWLQLSLDVMSLKDRGTGYVEDFQVSPDGSIRCSIASISANAMVDKDMSRDEQLYYYKTWVSSVLSKIEKQLSRLPSLQSRFDPKRDLVVEILYDYGKGAYRICEFKNDQVTWHEHIK